MGKGVNCCVFLGNLGRDPEIRYAASGTAVCNFSMAVADREKKDGEWVEVTDWINVVTFGKTAENCEKFLNKGASAHIIGKMKTRKWQDKEGTDRYTTEIIANDVTFAGGGQPKQERPALQQQSGGYHNTNTPDPDDTPF